MKAWSGNPFVKTWKEKKSGHGAALHHRMKADMVREVGAPKKKNLYQRVERRIERGHQEPND